ncbi:hypothetical protein APY04_0473 [Hyphomicrobium sulfonivorans]|uniref:Uncharacterized protein n=1 Tax=Hyphomicrobium sulfonivorans TaxID=121290 RepID=A0A109BNS1_HYPSL|nr:hypothetical protein APY04_0473 [Hyphomicrobium sulfonivorans]
MTERNASESTELFEENIFITFELTDDVQDMFFVSPFEPIN